MLTRKKNPPVEPAGLSFQRRGVSYEARDVRILACLSSKFSSSPFPSKGNYHILRMMLIWSSSRFLMMLDVGVPEVGVAEV